LIQAAENAILGMRSNRFNKATNESYQTGNSRYTEDDAVRHGK
jgi:hypothetical protein